MRNEKSILFSIKPQFAKKIFDGSKKIELRRVLPKRISAGSVVVVYASSPLKKILGYFTVKSVESFNANRINPNILSGACINEKQATEYFKDKALGFAIHIDYSVPLDTRSIHFYSNIQLPFPPPQSFRYIDFNDFDLITKLRL